MTKRQKIAMMEYLEQEPGSKFLTADEIRKHYPDMANHALTPNSTFMTDNTIITVKFN